MEYLKDRFSTLWHFIVDSKYYICMLAAIFINIAYLHIDVSHAFVGVPVSCFDTFFMLLIAGLCSMWKLKIAYTISFVISLLWSVVNVIYARYFNQYISMFAFTQVNNLDGGQYFTYFLEGLRARDFVYLLSISLFAFALAKSENKRMTILIYILMPLAVSMWKPIRHHSNFTKYLTKYYGVRCWYTYVLDTPSIIHSNGFFLSHGYCHLYKSLFRESAQVFSEDEKNELRNYLSKIQDERFDNRYKGKTIAGKNIVLIIVESFLSVSSDMSANGIEITPNLNRYKHTEGNYYNGNVHQNVTRGESSDGQFITLTGLLPLKNEVTIGEIANAVPALPSMLRDSLHYHTYITVPTSPNCWRQQDMNKCYGIDTIFSTGANGWASDSEVMQLALEQEQNFKEPYLHVILTISMHGGYANLKRGVPPCDFNLPKEYSNEFKNYMMACHYTDSVINDYIEQRKQAGRFDNTVFAIVADHEAHKMALNMDDDSLLNNRNLPFYIINADIDSAKVLHSDINQIDIYPTLLDLTGIQTKDRGLGHSVLDVYGYDFNISDTLWRVSEFLIREDGE